MLIPPSLAAYPQFVRYIVVPSKTRPGKTDKFPVNPHTGQVADAHDPSNWMTAADALACQVGQGVGFVFTEQDPFFFLDIDNALQTDGQWSPTATQLCQQFNGCWIEVSQSGTGLHIIGSSAPFTHGTRNEDHHLELYTKKRFVALTGRGAIGDPSIQADIALAQLLAMTGWSGTPLAGGGAADWTTEPVPEWAGPEDDQALIDKMLASTPSAAAVFGDKLTVSQLWGGEHSGDQSSGDMALCSHLAFWTGKNCERMDRLFRQSGLMRDKWDRNAGQGMTYGQLTITKAVANCQAVYSGGRIDPQRTGINGLREGSQFLSVPAQVNYFEGCVYIQALHKIWTPDGSFLDQGRFNASYGGYVFALDLANEKTTRKAWEAYTESNGFCFPRAHKACFRPELKSGAIVDEEGIKLVNTYVPIDTEQRQGDPAPFLQHIAKLLPDQYDQQILLAYAAALVQYPGVKFQWMPLLQGVEGNGKSFVGACLEHAVGKRYTHKPNAKDISNKFNAWLEGKLFINIEEVYTIDREDVVETMKPLITNSRVEIQGKGDNQETGDNRANFFGTTNHHVAIRKTNNDRRYAVFFTAQQRAEDLFRDGMTGVYFPQLYRWARDCGYAIVNWYLRNYKIPDELNPATSCQVAPRTSTTDMAIKASRGRIEQEIVEAIEEDRPGFAGGWISSLALNKLLQEIGATRAMPPARRRDMMLDLGYEWHPGLKNGAVNNTVMDVCGLSGKPKLYIKTGHLATNLNISSEIHRVYMQAQSGVTPAGLAFQGSQVNFEKPHSG